MTLNDAIEAELPFLRQQAESMMTLTLAAYSPNGTTTDADGFEVPAYAPEGGAKGYLPRSRRGQRGETDYVTIGGVDRPIRREGLSIPFDAFIDPVTDLCRIVASEQRGVAWEFEVVDLGDPANPAVRGARFMVVGVSLNSLTAQRLDVVEV